MGKVPSLPGLPLADAAAHMGVSVDTLRRRIRRGELEAVKDDRGRYRMEVADTWPLPGGGGGHAAAVSLDYFAEVALLGHAAAVSLDTSADYSAEGAVPRERVARLEDELEAAEVAQREMRALVAQAQSVQLRLMGGEVVILSDEMRALVSHYGLCVKCLTADAIFEGECFYCALDRLTAAPLAGPSVGEQ